MLTKGDKMNLTPQILKNGEKNEFAVLHYDDYLQMVQKIEDLEDLLELRRAKEADQSNVSISARDVLSEIQSAS